MYLGFWRFNKHCVLRSEEHTSELQSRRDLVCRLLLEKKNTAGEPITRCSPMRSPARPTQDPSSPSTPAPPSRRDPFLSFTPPATTKIYTLSLHDALPI